MPEDTMTDVAVVAYRDDGRWEAVALPPAALDGLDPLVASMRRLPAESGVLAFVALGDDGFLVVRAAGSSVRLLLSDAAAAVESALAEDVLDDLGLPVPDDVDDEEVEPAGDLAVLADLGVSPMDLRLLCEDLDLYPDEALGRLATRLGFGRQYEEAYDTATR